MKDKPISNDDLGLAVWGHLSELEQDHLLALAGNPSLVAAAGHRAVWCHPGLRLVAFDLAVANLARSLASPDDPRPSKRHWRDAEGALTGLGPSEGVYRRLMRARALLAELADAAKLSAPDLVAFELDP